MSRPTTRACTCRAYDMHTHGICRAYAYIQIALCNVRCGAHAHVHMHAHVHVHVACTCEAARRRLHMHMCMHMCMSHAHAHVHVHMHMHMLHVHVHVHVHVVHVAGRVASSEPCAGQARGGICRRRSRSRWPRRRMTSDRTRRSPPARCKALGAAPRTAACACGALSGALCTVH